MATQLNVNAIPDNSIVLNKLSNTSIASDTEIDEVISEVLDNIDVLSASDITEIINQQF
jgi:hypothetical protein